MSEARKDSAHGTGIYGERQQRNLVGGIELPTHRKRRLSSNQQGPGIFDAPNVLPENPVQPKELPRAPLFKKGTVLYAAVYRNERPVLPFNEVQADDLTKEVLDFEENLEISAKSIGLGKRGQQVIKPIGRSSYGAFVEVLIHKKDRNGKNIEEKRFVRLQDRSLAGDNQKLRFKEATQ